MSSHLMGVFIPFWQGGLYLRLVAGYFFHLSFLCLLYPIGHNKSMRIYVLLEFFYDLLGRSLWPYWNFSMTYWEEVYDLLGRSLWPISLKSLDFTWFLTPCNQVSNQVSNQAINQGKRASLWQVDWPFRTNEKYIGVKPQTDSQYMAKEYLFPLDWYASQKRDMVKGKVSYADGRATLDNIPVLTFR